MQRQVFTLYKIECKSYKEASEILGVFKATINTHISLATKSLKQELIQGDNILLATLLTLAISNLS